MTEPPQCELVEAVKAYLSSQSLETAARLNAAIGVLSDDGAFALSMVVEMVVSLKGEVATEKLLRSKLEELLSKAVGTTVTNIAQAGDKNAAQSGNGTQTISGDDAPNPPKGGKDKR